MRKKFVALSLFFLWLLVIEKMRFFSERILPGALVNRTGSLTYKYITVIHIKIQKKTLFAITNMDEPPVIYGFAAVQQLGSLVCHSWVDSVSNFRVQIVVCFVKYCTPCTQSSKNVVGWSQDRILKKLPFIHIFSQHWVMQFIIVVCRMDKLRDEPLIIVGGVRQNREKKVV